MQSIDDLEVAGKTVLVRSDLNTPLSDTADGAVAIADDGRIRAALPTISDLVSRGARVVVVSHLGRPKGEAVIGLSLGPVAERMGELLAAPVRFCPETVGPVASGAIKSLTDGDILVLENLRFHAAETSKDDAVRGAFADQLVTAVDCYVGDGFGVSHRRHASVYDVALRRPHAAGRLVVSEVQVLDRLVSSPSRPYVVVLGGSKVSDKLAVIDALMGRADTLVIGGGMAFTFLAAMGYSTGSSLLEPDLVDTCRDYLARAEAEGVTLLLPTDVVVADRFAPDAEHRIVSADAIPDGWMGLDIGPASASNFADQVGSASTVFWNGPMGVFEFPAFAAGTSAVASSLAAASAFTVVGGGDSAAAVRSLGFSDSDFSHISTGGGASLEYLEGRQLPGLMALEA